MVALRVLVYCLCLIVIGNLFAQTDFEQCVSQTEEDRDRFLKILEDETRQASNDFDTPAFFTLIPERLPSWINQIPVSRQNKIYVLGISDPGMDDKTGFIVASIRMRMIYSLLNKTLVRNMRDFYMREKHARYANAFIDYTHFSNNIITDFSEIKIVESHTTKYGETILLGEVDISGLDKGSSSGSRLQASAGIWSNARRIGTRTEIISKVNFKTSYEPDGLNGIMEFSYEAHAVNRRVNTTNKFNGKTISSIPALNLRYTIENHDGADSVRTDLIGYSLRNGIWYAYLTAILFELADMAHGNAIHVSNISEIFDNTAQDFTRELVSSSVSCKQKQIMIRSNNLYLKCGQYNNLFMDGAERNKK